MSVTDLDVKEVYSGNGSTTTFAIPFQYANASQVKVKLYEIATGLETLQTLTTHYSIVGTNIVFVSAPSDEYNVVVYRETPKLQSTTFLSGTFPAAAINSLFDSVVYMIQELGEAVDRCVQTVMGAQSVITSFPKGEAFKLLAWDETGSSLVNIDALDIENLQTQITNNLNAIGVLESAVSVNASNISSNSSAITLLQAVDTSLSLRLDYLEAVHSGYGVRIGDLEAAVALLEDQSAPIAALQALTSGHTAAIAALQAKDIVHTTAINSNTLRIGQLETLSYMLSRRRSGSMAITNGAASTDVVGELSNLVLNSSACRSAEISIEIDRKTNLKTIFTSGRLIMHFINNEWKIIRDTTTSIAGVVADDSTPDGVQFYVENSQPIAGVYVGKVYFTADTQSGTGYAGNLRWLLQEMRLP